MVSEKVSKVESKQLGDYELVTIINPEVPDEELDSIVDSVSQFITGKGGIVSKVERWGKRKLAYPIQHFMEGNYILTHFKLNLGLSKELEKNLRISEKLLRYLLIRLRD